MDKKLEDDSVDDVEMSDDSELAPLRALDRALKNRVRVSTSTIQLVPTDPSTIELIGIEGDPTADTLRCLKDSLSDLVKFPDRKSSFSRVSTDSIDRKIGSSIFHESTSATSSTNGRTQSSSSTIPSCTSSFDGPVDADALEKAERAIADLQENGPAGLVQLSCLSDVLQQPIRIWNAGNEEIRKIGKDRTGQPIDVEYHESDEIGREIGHWTLRGNEEPGDVEGGLNDCLFSVVADQTNVSAPELRAATVARMRKNVKSLANRIEKIAKLEKCDRISLLVGGARYTGSRPQDACRIIDASQQGQCHPHGRHGHPRGHASYPEGQGPTDSAENYSSGGMKTAFLSREDQDAVGHLALQTPAAQQAMRELNNGQTNVAVHIRPNELEPGALPNVVEFSQGRRYGSEQPFRDLVLVLRHHLGEKNNPDADVFVNTFYPRI